MLTVMYRDEWGNEGLHEANRVDYFPPDRKDNPVRAACQCDPGVLVTMPNDTKVHFGIQLASQSGHVPREIFVMNEKGATVARYGL